MYREALYVIIRFDGFSPCITSCGNSCLNFIDLPGLFAEMYGSRSHGWDGEMQWTDLHILRFLLPVDTTSSLLSCQFQVVVCLKYRNKHCLHDVNSPKLTISPVCSWQLLLLPFINPKAVTSFHWLSLLKCQILYKDFIYIYLINPSTF